MVKKIIILLLCVLVVGAALAGCTENYKRDAVATDDLSNAVVQSNGGLAVKLGKYLYYINGYAGNTVDNSYGDVLKGAIVRAEINEEGIPDYKTNVVIVPKNVYNTVATSGLYIQDGYLYYSSPSVDKDKTGAVRTAAMYLMRSKLDGTGTQVIAKFDDYTPVYKVVSGYILYMNSSNELHQIDLNAKKFTDKTVDTDVTSYYSTPRADDENALVNAIFYIKAAEVKTDTHNVVWAYRAGSESPVKVIVGNEPSYPAASLEISTGYTLALVESLYIGDKLRLVYTKTDSGPNTRSNGTYSFDFDQTLSFDHTKEVRYTSGRNITKLYFLDDENLIATLSTDICLFRKINGEFVKDVVALIPNSAVIFKVVKAENSIEIYYTASSKISRLKVLEKTETGYVVDFAPEAVEVFTSSYSTTWLQPEEIGGLIYFWNTNAKDYTYYLNLSKVLPRDSESLTPVQLSLITGEDEVALLTT
ncbi:MAG: DUF5050 domain-containing protein [Christensenellaceae bacterium]|jgi:hypothetical protein|nr:DUF5050 domain-containing protein [Christensenellaceae bacterium]